MDAQPVQYYDTRYVMDVFRISRKDYITLGKVCKRFKIPRMKIGKHVLFPSAEFDARMRVVNAQLIRR